MRFVLLVLICVMITGCFWNTKDDLPKETIITVEKFKPLPSWATEQYQIPQPTDGTVGARAVSHEERGWLLETLLCHRHLLTLLDKGEKADAKECDQH